MIVENDTDIEVLGTLKGAAVEMDFAAGAKGHLMNVLARSLYSRPEEAVLREYSTNALDAQKEAGYKGPIEITLPTDLNPILSIRDRGTGLDWDGICTVYSQYGASTKRDSNDYNGTLGLGGKSAFAISNRFTVVSVKNGRRIEVIVTRNEDGTGDMVNVTPREGEPTADPQGTTVKIPTKRGADFRDVAAKLFKWFEPGSVKVGGNVHPAFDPKSNNVIEVGAGVYVVKHNDRTYGGPEEDDQIVMGNIAYPAKLDTGLERRMFHVVAFVPIGEVNFQPSREALLNNKHTKAALDKIVATVQSGLQRTVQAKIDAAADRPTAAALAAQWEVMVPLKMRPQGGWSYKGQIIPEKFTAASNLQRDSIRILPVSRSYRHAEHTRSTTISKNSFKGALWVTDYAAEKLSAPQAQKARKYVLDNNLSVNSIVWVGAIPADLRPWLEHAVDYDVIKAVKLVVVRGSYSSTASGRIPGSYDVRTTHLAAKGHRSEIGVAADDFKDWPGTLCYTVNAWAYSSYIADALDAIGKPYTLVCIGGQREAKLVRSFPHIRKANDLVSAGYNDWQTKIGADVPLAMAVQRNYATRHLRALDPAKIDDPKLAEYVRLCKLDVESVRTAAYTFETVLRGGKTIKEPGVDESIVTQYPLLNCNKAKHSTVYVNAVYAARRAGTL